MDPHVWPVQAAAQTQICLSDTLKKFSEWQGVSLKRKKQIWKNRMGLAQHKANETKNKPSNEHIDRKIEKLMGNA